MRLSDFLNKKSYEILIGLVLILLFISSFLLWGIPLQVTLNPLWLSLFIYVVYLVLLYSKARREWKEQQQHQEDYEELERQLQTERQSFKEFSDIIRVWSHQMKVPISAIDLLAQTETDGVNPEELRNQTFALEGYLKILLETERITDLSTDFHFEKVKVSEVIKELVKKYSRFFIQKNLSFEISGEWELTTDKRWLSLALEQFLSNAIKYTREGGVKVNLSEGNISIQDTGVGILKEDIPRLFEHGFTGFNGRSQKEKSTGLGLYLSKLILDKLDLQVENNSEIDKGTEVKIY